MVRKKGSDTEPDAVPAETAPVDEPVMLREPAEEPVSSSTEAAPRPEPRRGGFFPLFLGVVLAAGAGFATAWYVYRDTGPRVDAVEARVAEVAGALVEVDRRLAAVNAAMADLPTRDAVAGLDTRVSEVAEGMAARADAAVAVAVGPVADRVERLSAALDARATAESQLRAAVEGLRITIEEVRASVDEMSRRPAVVEGDAATEAAAAAYERELAAMREMLARELESFRAEADRQARAMAATEADLRAMLEAESARLREQSAVLAQSAAATEVGLRSMLEGELSRMREQATEVAAAETAAEAARTQAVALTALTAIESALRNGTAFMEHVDALAAAMPTAPAEGIRPYAGGIDTLEALQRDYPPVARAALAVAPAEGGVGTFLRAQLGMRSLAPREGADADAVLSRAEAALGAGDIAAALALVETLQGEPAAAMAAWADRARARVAAEAALGELGAAVRG